jgi:septum formation protein
LIPLVLASTSIARRALLTGVGLDHEALTPGVDEATEKARLGSIPADALAAELADLKALAGARLRPGALVIGADQTLSCDSMLYDKPVDLNEARSHLQRLRGRTHTLHAAICVARDERVIWRHLTRARLTMRDFSDSFLEHYIALCGETLTTSVGAYRLEGPGPQLFERIEGDYFTILGLPLLPLLDFLRGAGVARN